MRTAGLRRRRMLVRLLVLAGLAGFAAPARTHAADLGYMSFNRPFMFDPSDQSELFFPWWIPLVSVGTEVEGTHEQNKVNGATSKYDQISVTPLLGFENKGYVYHPNLCSFNISGDAGWTWESTSSKGSGYNDSQSQKGDLVRYLAQVNFLQSKPYNANFFAAQDHTYRDYGDFSTATVDSTRYGGGINYGSAQFTLTTEAGYWNEKNSSLTGYSEISQTYFNLNAVHLRESGQTTFTTRANDYGNKLDTGSDQNSQNFGVSLADSETLGARKHISLTTGAAYSHAEYSGQQLDTFNANQNVNINHSAVLDSYGNADYSRTDLQATDGADINRVLGAYGLRHQLYESLVSGVDAHGYYENNSSGGSSTYDYYGVGWTEDYTKKLLRWGRLSAGSALVLNHQDSDSSGGPVTTVSEPHVLTLSGPPVFLDKPNVIQSSVVVRGPGGVLCAEGVDYTLAEVGQLTQVILVPTSTILQSGDTILVTYQSDSNYNASYESLNGSFNIRLDLYDRLGVYMRLNWMDNNAPANVLAETLTDWIFGADYSWRWLRAGVEYEDYNSSFTKYQAIRCFQNLNFHPGPASTLGVNFNESSYHYSGANDQNQFSVIAHYHVRFLNSLAWFSEAGFIYLQVFDDDQKSGTARTGLTWTRGKLSTRLGYEFSGQQSGTGGTSQEFVRHYFYLNLKRNF